jgi:hypothetical protein
MGRVICVTCRGQWLAAGGVMAALTLAALAGCPPDPTGRYQGCAADRDCLNGYRCVQAGEDVGRCVASADTLDGGGLDAGGCPVALLLEICRATGAAADTRACRCVPLPAADASTPLTDASVRADAHAPPDAHHPDASPRDANRPDAGAPDAGTPGDAGRTDGAACDVSLLERICRAVGHVTDTAGCRCVPPPPDGGADAAVGPADECMRDADCGDAYFCCGRRCYPWTARHVDEHCGCLESRVGNQGVPCGSSRLGVCLAPDGGRLADLPAADRWLLHSAPCGCTADGPAHAECGVEPDGLTRVCLDHRCVSQDDHQCGVDLTPCTAPRGGPRCVAVDDGGVGACSCDLLLVDVALACGFDGTTPFRPATRCVPRASGATWGRCQCGEEPACAGLATHACCGGSSASSCVDLTSSVHHCGLCGAACYAPSNLCAVRSPGSFPSCAYLAPNQTNYCMPTGGTAANPLCGTNISAPALSGSSYPCVCNAFQANGQASACPPGTYCCPTTTPRTGGGCCRFDCAVSPDAGNTCTRQYWSDAGPSGG